MAKLEILTKQSPVEEIRITGGSMDIPITFQMSKGKPNKELTIITGEGEDQVYSILGPDVATFVNALERLSKYQ